MLQFLGIDNGESLFLYNGQPFTVPVANWTHPLYPDGVTADTTLLTCAFATPDGAQHSISVPISGDPRSQALFFHHDPADAAAVQAAVEAQGVAWVLDGQGNNTRLRMPIPAMTDGE